jgi:3-oxoacid CoA-transferase subunit A
MCGAASTTVVEVEELVQVGELDPNQIHTPGIFVDRIFQGDSYERKIEKLTLSKP